MLHAVALHQDLLGLQRRQGVFLHDAQNQLEQHLQLVAVQNDESGAQGVGHGQVSSLLEPRLMDCACGACARSKSHLQKINPHQIYKTI